MIWQIGSSLSLQEYLSGAVFTNGIAASPPQASTSAVTLDYSSQPPTRKSFKDSVHDGPRSKPSPAAACVKAQSRHDPNAPGAIVMKRPSQAHQKRFNEKGLTIVDVVLDPDIAKVLRPHQVEFVCPALEQNL